MISLDSTNYFMKEHIKKIFVICHAFLLTTTQKRIKTGSQSGTASFIKSLQVCQHKYMQHLIRTWAFHSVEVERHSGDKNKRNGGADFLGGQETLSKCIHSFFLAQPENSKPIKFNGASSEKNSIFIIYYNHMIFTLIIMIKTLL